MASVHCNTGALVGAAGLHPPSRLPTPWLVLHQPLSSRPCELLRRVEPLNACHSVTRLKPLYHASVGLVGSTWRLNAPVPPCCLPAGPCQAGRLD